MSKKEIATITAIIICTLAVIIIPAILGVNGKLPTAPSESESDKLGDVVITENLGLSETDVVDSDFEVTDGPTGGDDPDLFNFQFENADKLIERGVTFGLTSRLYESFSRFQSENKDYRKAAVYTIDYDTYVDNDSQTVFEFSSPQYEGTVFQLVYSKSTYEIKISVK